MTAGAQPLRLPLPELEGALARACGVSLSPGVRQALLDGFARGAREVGLGPGPFLRRVLAGEPRCTTALVENVVVGETYFYRHPEQLAGVARRLIEPQPLDRPLSIWSAGCASGEEPYTLAMMLVEAGRRHACDRILATDVSGRALAAAAEARYGEWSLRRLDPSLRARFFRPAGRTLALDPSLTSAVTLRRHNLVTEPPPGSGFDLVLCRNVLIYFAPETALRVLGGLAGALRPGGWLLLGAAEGPLATGLGLERVDLAGATLLRRPSEEPAPRPGLPAPAPPLVQVREADFVQAPALVPVDADDFEAARAAARAGDLAGAERIAREAAERRLCPESWLLLAMAAEARGDEAAALDAIRRALYLDPSLAQAHAAQVPLLARLGRAQDAARARRNALEALRGLSDDTVLRGVEPITAGALRLALDPGAAWPAGGRHA